MIPTSMNSTAANLAPAVPRLVLLVLAALGACATDRETTLSRTARQREAAAERSDAERLKGELTIVRQQVAETSAQITAAKSESARLGSVLRATLAGLDHQVSVLRAAEQDLEAAKARAVAIEHELAPLRALEQTLRDQETLRTAAQQKVAALQAEVTAVEQASGAKVAELQPRLLALQQQLAAAQQVEKALADVQATVAAAAAVLVPAAAKPESPPKK